MDTIRLAKLLMKNLRWSHERLASAIGISRQVVHRMITGPISTKRRDRFHLGIVAVAFKNGLESEALSVLLGRDRRNLRDTSVLRAAILYPDLTPDELQHLLEVEEMTGVSPLPGPIIRSTIEKLRST